MAVVVEMQEGGRGSGPDWARKYPPLLALAVAMLMVVAILPSALNLPQANPTQTLEYAPVPPDDQSNDSSGNTSELGLGSSAAIKGGGAEGGEGAGGLAPLPGEDGDLVPPPAKGKNCVTHPDGVKRQTEDPLSPPCVATFKGKNYGSTYQGVDGKTVKLLIYIEGGINYISGSDPQNRVTPVQKYFDLSKDPDPAQEEHLLVKGFRAWQRYFNDRFQTYGRFVNFIVYFSSGPPSSPEGRRADAADNYSKVKPFAVLSDATEGNEDAYLEAMARKGVLNFGSFGLRPEKFFQGFPKLIWSYLPSIEQHHKTFNSYLCKKVIPNKVQMSGNPNENGKDRKFGIIRTSDQKQEGLRIMAAKVEAGMKECGYTQDFVYATMPECCLAQDNGEVPAYAQQQMADFKSKGVTTIIWPGGINGNYGKSAASQSYYPEWIILGDSLLDANYPVRLSQNGASFDNKAIVVTPQTYEPALEQQLCYRAFREANQTMPRGDLYSYVCDDYKNLFQFFVGVQVAGPRLGPTSVDKGFHAIPQRRSGNPQVPACFYLPGDYTCVKDAQMEIWDDDGVPPGDNRPGCWRAIEGGTRYLPEQIPGGNVRDQMKNPNDPASEPCNGYTSSVRFNLA